MNYLPPLAVTATLLTAASVQADTLSIPIGQQTVSEQISVPQRGTSANAVSQEHGDPINRHAAVGEPPISRWDYPRFSVYFEYDKVVHSVHQHKTASN